MTRMNGDMILVTIECSCGSSITIDDPREQVLIDVYEHWQTHHKDHRPTIEEFMAQLDRFSPPKIED